MSTVAFKTIGCRLNQAETAMLAGQISSHGMTIVPWGEPADVMVIHTCAVTAKAERDCLRLSRSAKRDFPEAKLILAGCAVQVDRERMKRESGADALLDQSDKMDLLSVIKSMSPDIHRNESVIAPSCSDRTRASVKVQDGCDFNCSYCIVPRARGKSVSRPHQEILREITALSRSGFKEVVLTGVNTGTYSDGGINLAKLILMIEEIETVERIRISSIEPTTAEDEIVEIMAKSSKLCKYLHLPIQSGDDHILSLMRRRHNTNRIATFLAHATKLVPGLGIGTDVIVGFPGETDAMFRNSYDFLRDMPFSNIHAFSYSSRPETPSASMQNQISHSVIKCRMAAMGKLKADKRNAFAESFAGKRVSVLVESVDAKGIGKGWTSEYVDARVKSAKQNEIIDFVPSSIANGCISS